MSIVRFPRDYEETNGNSIVFIEHVYSRSDRLGHATASPTGKSIALPIPSNLEANHIADWENASMGAWNSFLNDNASDMAGGARNVINDYKSGKANLVDSIRSNFNVKDLAGGAITAAATDAFTSNAIFKNISASVGIAKNPFLAVMFNQMNLRTFNFQYKLIPKSYEDSVTIAEIIKFFKMAQHPEFGVDFMNNLMKYPNMFEIKLADPELEKLMFKYGMCVLTDVSVNYHAEGQAVYFEKDGKRAPASIMLSLTFREIEMNTKETIEAGR